MAPAGTFTFDGKEVPFESGDTFAHALHRAGIRAVSRSLKYHRPRGLFCMAGSCASCFVDVDGVPNTPACMALAEGGCTLRSQNVLGNAKHDVLGVVDKVYRKGFDPHGAFTRPALVNKAFLVGVRMMSGLGRAPPAEGRTSEPAPPPAQRRTLAVDELVVGAGRSGLARAVAAHAQGLDVLLVDERPELGGSAAWDATETDAPRLAREARALGDRAWTDTLCFGLYRQGRGILAALRRIRPDGCEDLWEVTAERITLATGSHDAWPIFENNDLPGILSLGGARRLWSRGVRPGDRIVVHGAPLPADLAAAWQAAGMTVVASGNVVAARGATHVTSALVGGAWHDCDAIVCHEPGTPRVELFQQAGCALAFRNGVLAARTGPDGATTVPGIHAGGA